MDIAFIGGQNDKFQTFFLCKCQSLLDGVDRTLHYSVEQDIFAFLISGRERNIVPEFFIL